MRHIKHIKELFTANKVGLRYLLTHYTGFFVLEIIFTIIGGVSGSVSAYMSKTFLDSIVTNQDLSQAMMVVVGVSTFILSKNILQSILKVYSTYCFSKVRIVSKLNFFEQAKKLNLAFFDIPENKDCITRAEQYASVGVEQLFVYFFSLLSNIIGCISIIYLLAPFEWWIFVCLAGFMAYKLIIDTIVSKKNFLHKKEKVLRERQIAYYSGAFKRPGILMDMHVYSGSGLFASLFNNYADENIDLQARHSAKMELLTISGYVTMLLQNIVLYWYAGSSLLNHQITVGEFSLFFTSINYFNIILMNMKNSISSFFTMQLEAQNYIDFTNINDDFNIQPIESGAQKTQITQIDTIEFKNVNFKYPLKNDFVLDNVSFTIKRGEIVSLVGMNGCGKTTIIKLLFGFYRPTSGDILINNISIDNIDITSLWKLSSTVFQQFPIYPFSIIENISMSEVSTSNIDKINYEIDKMNLRSRVNREKLNVHTPLSREFDNDGTVLSGGEKQKIAFAKADYKSSQLFALDEPSSALDATAEQELFDFIQNSHSNDRVVIFVSHRLSTSTIADKIVYLEKGKVLCIGDHSHLMVNCVPYQKMFTMQAKKYNTTPPKQ